MGMFTAREKDIAPAAPPATSHAAAQLKQRYADALRNRAGAEERLSFARDELVTTLGAATSASWMSPDNTAKLTNLRQRIAIGEQELRTAEAEVTAAWEPFERFALEEDAERAGAAAEASVELAAAEDLERAAEAKVLRLHGETELIAAEKQRLEGGRPSGILEQARRQSDLEGLNRVAEDAAKATAKAREALRQAEAVRVAVHRRIAEPAHALEVFRKTRGVCKALAAIGEAHRVLALARGAFVLVLEDLAEFDRGAACSFISSREARISAVELRRGCVEVTSSVMSPGAVGLLANDLAPMQPDTINFDGSQGGAVKALTYLAVKAAVAAGAPLTAA